jgi:UDP-glucuronate 4-epimerase
MVRDFTYIDDVVEGICRVLDLPPKANPAWDGHSPDPASSLGPYRIYNIGNSQPVNLMRYIEVLENCLGKKAIVYFQPMQPGDVPETCADTTELQRDVGYKPDTSVEEGVGRFVDWYMEYYVKAQE